MASFWIRPEYVVDYRPILDAPVDAAGEVVEEIRVRVRVRYKCERSYRLNPFHIRVRVRVRCKCKRSDRL